MNFTTRRIVMGGAALAASALASGPATAHFRLVEPAATLMQDDRGDPQKIAPCGGTSKDAGKPSGAKTTLKGGQTLHFKMVETVYHPGHYRIALARTAEGLPRDPATVTRPGPRGPLSVSAMIDPDPQPPMWADGLFPHHERPATMPMTWETDLKVPNVDCADCVIQVVQWMGEHGFNPDGEYSYHHCAAVTIKRDPRRPLDRNWARLLMR